MAEFNFTVAGVAQRVCLSGSDDRFEVQRVVNGLPTPYRVSGLPVFVGGLVGPCVTVSEDGDYVIAWSDSICGGNVPVFSAENAGVDMTLSRSVLGDAALDLSSDVVSSLTVPDGANHAEIQVWDGGVVWTVSGSDPDNQVGNLTSAGGWIELESAEEIANFKALNYLGNASLYVTFYEVNGHVE